MLIAKDIVYLQLQKTGCSHIEVLLKRLFDGVKSMGKHYRMPDNFDTSDKIVLGSIRNPWEWYLSYWSYSCLGKGGPYFRSIAKFSPLNVVLDSRLKNSRGDLKRSPRQIISAVVADGNKPTLDWMKSYSDIEIKNFRSWLKLALDPKRKYDLFQDYGHSEVCNVAGIMTFLYLFLYLKSAKPIFQCKNIRDVDALKKIDSENNITNYMIRTESLERDLLDALVAEGYNFSKSELDKIINTSRTNISKKAYPLATYYDQECIDLVYNNEKFLIDKYKYTI